MEIIVNQPISEKVAHEIRQAIYNNELKPGQILAQEEIAQKLGVSRIPVREAFRELEKSGLLVFQNNRRAVVANLTVKELSDHYTIRAILESEAAARASLNQEAYEEIKSLHQEAEKYVRDKNIIDYIKVNELFHREIWEASDSRYLVILLNQLWYGLPPRSPELLLGQAEQSIIEHKAIVNAIISGSVEDARMAMKNHIERSKQDFIKAMSFLNEK
jgi:DNA-binding GntR family transcriptional regulator